MISDHINIFNTPPVRALVPGLHFVVKSCIHTVINLLRPSEPDQTMPYLSPYRRPVPNSAEFRENTEIPRKQANSAARLKIPRHAKNCDPTHRTQIY